MKLLAYCLAIFNGILTITAQNNIVPSLYLHSGYKCTNPLYEPVHFSTGANIASLGSYGFDDVAYSVKIIGPWLFYELDNYNEAIAQWEYLFAPYETCFDLNPYLVGHLSSLRSIGDALDYTRPTITFYSSINFQGEAEYAFDDEPYLIMYRNQRSLIITGTDGWTFYDMPNYNGNRTCIRPKNTEYIEPFRISNFGELSPPIPMGSIASVKRGCLFPGN